RGIDVAFVYDAKKFEIEKDSTNGQKLIFSHFIMKRKATRDILQVNFKTKGLDNRLVLIGNHATKSVGGILFGIAFWSVAKNIQNKVVKNYLVISAYGMVLLFTANQPVGLTLIPYPPFGLATISFVGLSAYLLFIGIYSASLSVALDSKLRSVIRKTTFEEAKFLKDIGTSEMERVIEKRVQMMMTRTQDDFKMETGIEP
ncbi:MAG: hypothetical protein WA941_21705, partial [Nitrososphaeraceae archaeon]